MTFPPVTRGSAPTLNLSTNSSFRPIAAFKFSFASLTSLPVAPTPKVQAKPFLFRPIRTETDEKIDTLLLRFLNQTNAMQYKKRAIDYALQMKIRPTRSLVQSQAGKADGLMAPKEPACLASSSTNEKNLTATPMEGVEETKGPHLQKRALESESLPVAKKLKVSFAPSTKTECTQRSRRRKIELRQKILELFYPPNTSVYHQGEKGKIESYDPTTGVFKVKFSDHGIQELQKSELTYLPKVGDKLLIKPTPSFDMPQRYFLVTVTKIINTPSPEFPHLDVEFKHDHFDLMGSRQCQHLDTLLPIFGNARLDVFGKVQVTKEGQTGICYAISTRKVS